MSEETDGIVEKVEELLNPEEFDVFAYIDNQPVAQETVEIAVNGKAARELAHLLDDRAEYLKQRRELAQRTGGVSDLAITDADADTEYDDRINELYDEVKKTALTFELTSVAPALQRAIRNKYKATRKSLGDDEEALEKHDEREEADILRRGIASVRTGDGKVSTKEWSVDDILKLDEKFYPEQSAKLIAALYSVISTGDVFDQALTPDFS